MANNGNVNASLLRVLNHPQAPDIVQRMIDSRPRENGIVRKVLDTISFAREPFPGVCMLAPFAGFFLVSIDDWWCVLSLWSSEWGPEQGASEYCLSHTDREGLDTGHIATCSLPGEWAQWSQLPLDPLQHCTLQSSRPLPSQQEKAVTGGTETVSPQLRGAAYGGMVLVLGSAS